MQGQAVMQRVHHAVPRLLLVLRVACVRHGGGWRVRQALQGLHDGRIQLKRRLHMRDDLAELLEAAVTAALVMLKLDGDGGHGEAQQPGDRAGQHTLLLLPLPSEQLIGTEICSI